MAKQVIPAYRAAKPAGPYSQAVRAGGLVFVSGQLPKDPASGDIVREPIEKAVETCFENVTAALSDAGLTLDNVVMVHLYLADMEDFARVNNVYTKVFPENPPARVTVQAARLPLDAPVEIHVIACEEEKLP